MMTFATWSAVGMWRSWTIPESIKHRTWWYFVLKFLHLVDSSWVCIQRRKSVLLENTIVEVICLSTSTNFVMFISSHRSLRTLLSSRMSTTRHILHQQMTTWRLSVGCYFALRGFSIVTKYPLVDFLVVWNPSQFIFTYAIMFGQLELQTFKNRNLRPYFSVPTKSLSSQWSNIACRTIGICVCFASTHKLNDKSGRVFTAKYSCATIVDLYLSWSPSNKNL